MRQRIGVFFLLAASLALAGCPAATTSSEVGNNANNNNTGGDTIVGTVHSGTISKDETWTKAKNPHVIDGSVYVESAAGATLTIEPGAIVKFKTGASLSFGSHSGTNGVLKAEGTATESISFTSIAASPAKGNWNSISLGNGGNTSTLKYCNLQYGGSDDGGALIVDGSKPSIEHCSFDQNAGSAIALQSEGSFTSFAGNSIKNSSKNPIKLSANAVGSLSLGAGNVFSGNGSDAIYVVGGKIDKSARWRNFGIPYQILDYDLDVGGNPAPVLTIDPGCILQFGQGRSLKVAWMGGEGGSLNAVGTGDSATESITFTSVAKSPAKGDWNQIYLGSGTSNANLKHCQVLYGGSEADSGALLVYGINNKPTVTDCRIENSGSFGLFLESDASFTSFDNNRIDNCTKHPVRIEANAVGSLGSNNTFSGSVQNSILITGGSNYTIDKDATWKKFAGTDYWIEDNVDVGASSGAPVLTIEPGCTLKFAQDRGLGIGRFNKSGALYAAGTAAAPITFTGMTATKGSWLGITIEADAVDGVQGNARTTQLKNVIVEYGGGEQADDNADLFIDNAKPLLDNATLSLRNSASHGLRVYGCPVGAVAIETAFSGILFSGNNLSDLRFEVDP